MRLIGFALAGLTLAGCSLGDPSVVAPSYDLVIVNDSDSSVFWSVEQPTGEMTRLELQPCSATSEPIEATRRWEVEWGATFAVTSDDVEPLNAPFTVIEVRFGPDGAVDVAPPRPSAARVDAPIDGFTCTGRQPLFASHPTAALEAWMTTPWHTDLPASITNGDRRAATGS